MAGTSRTGCGLAVIDDDGHHAAGPTLDPGPAQRPAAYWLSVGHLQAWPHPGHRYRCNGVRPNADPEGPTSATYTLARDLNTLRAAFNDTVDRSDAVICPPNIQSPGPWQRNESPTIPRGTLFCGVLAGRPIVAWTNDAHLLLNVVHGDAPGATVDGLYKWWSSHS